MKTTLFPSLRKSISFFPAFVKVQPPFLYGRSVRAVMASPPSSVRHKPICSSIILKVARDAGLPPARAAESLKLRYFVVRAGDIPTASCFLLTGRMFAVMRRTGAATSYFPGVFLAFLMGGSSWSEPSSSSRLRFPNNRFLCSERRSVSQAYRHSYSRVPAYVNAMPSEE